jgi:flagellar biosynthesis protein
MKNKKRRQAAALKYDIEKDDAPYVVALGEGYLADKMVEKAKEEGIKIVEDESLASMLQKVSIGDAIPEELYSIVAQILVFINSVDQDYAKWQEKNR